MKKLLFAFGICFPLLTTVAIAKEPFVLGAESPSRIFVNNRILATVNGKAISVIDVMKKMDMLFYKQFPQYTSSVPARFQFYQINWKHILQELIDKELILADAAEHKLPLTGGDVRQEMEEMFGPNIIVNLDKVGLTFEEAWKMVEEDIKLKRMIYFCANSRAIRRVTPKDVRAAYEEYSQKNIRPEEWEYTVISIRDSDQNLCSEAATLAHKLLSEEKIKIEELSEKIKANSQTATAKINVSEAFKHGEKDLSPAYKTVLATLNPDSFSQPVSQKSRDNTAVYRIFYLKNKHAGGVVPFNEVDNEIKDSLLNQAVAEETEKYLNKLRHHYHLHESHIKSWTPENFEPFVMK